MIRIKSFLIHGISPTLILLAGLLLTTPEVYAQKVKLRRGDEAPELKFNDPEGNELALSDLKGKIVLIDFWASWCGPCRRANPHVVKLYNKYKNVKFKGAKGFEVYSVSLDRDKNKWVEAIAKDKLDWKYHVSDLKHWNSEAAAIYGVRAIPKTFLINEDGVIIGMNLHHDDIDFELSRRQKKK